MTELTIIGGGLAGYCAYLVGSAVESQVVQAGHGSFDMFQLNEFTVNVYQSDRTQLKSDLVSWFSVHNLLSPDSPYSKLPVLPGFFSPLPYLFP